jgi:hypothetical protein
MTAAIYCDGVLPIRPTKRDRGNGLTRLEHECTTDVAF